MHNPDQSSPAFKQAYHVFMEELAAQVRYAKILFEQGAELDLERLTKLSHAFHRLKGGAGFFGLKHIAVQAEVIERLLLRPLEEVRSESCKLPEMLRQLETAIDALPSPKIKGGSRA